MSLINDVLKDLDRDQPTGEQPLPPDLVARQSDQPQKFRHYLLPGLAVIAIAYALVVEWNVLGVMPEKKSALSEIPQPIALNSKWLKQNPETRAATPIDIDKPVAISTSHNEVAARPESLVADRQNSAEEYVEPAARTEPSLGAEGQVVARQVDATIEQATAVAEPFAAQVSAELPAEDASHSDAIYQLLNAAAQGLAANRLTTPAGNNAYQLYNSVLVVDPTNAAAHSGIELIRQRYLSWLDKALVEQRIAAAQLYWQKAQSVGVDTATLARYEVALVEATEKSAHTPPVVELSQPGATRSEPTITPATILSDEEMAARLHSEGLRREQDALHLLTRSADAPQTAVALTDLYAERRAITDLRRLANLLKDQPVQHYVVAQLFVLEGEDQRALSALSSAEFSGGAELQRMRLLAALRQQAGQYAAAMELYARLVAASPDNVSDWLGLAVSADKGKLTGAALNAYEKVLLLRHPDQRVMRFAHQRQQDLSLAVTNHR